MWRVFRSARRHPLTTVVAILSLALGIGVNTAVFSLADALFLRPLDVREPGRLVFASARSDAGRPDVLSYPEYEDVAREASVFAGVVAYDERATTWRAEDRLELLLLSAVTSNYFDVLGVHPALGRTFDAAIDRDLPSPPVLLSHSLWARRLGSDAAIIGRPVRLGDRSYTVIGVLPASFTGLQRGTITDVYIDLDTWGRFYGRREDLSSRGARHFTVLARLAPDASHETAATVLGGLGARWRTAYPATNRGRALVGERAFEIAGESGRPTGWLLVAIVALVLAIACANVGMLLVAQSEARRREFAVRMAIGAGRRHIIGQMLAEGGVLAAAGTTIGLLFGRWLIALAPAVLPPSDVAVDFGIALDRRVLAVTCAAGVFAALASGLLPALAAMRTDVAPALKPTEAESRHRGRLRTALVVVQIALAVAVLHTAGLLVASFLAVRADWPGFDTRKPLRVLVLSMNGPSSRYAATLETLRTHAAALPGVARATFVRRIPLAGYGGGATVSVSASDGAEAAREPREVRYNQVGPEYLETLGTRLLSGRFFSTADRLGPPTVVVSRALADMAFGARDPLGRYLHVDEQLRQIVGVVEDARISGLHEQREPFLYLPFEAAPSTDVALVVETEGHPEGLARQLAAVVAAFGDGAIVLSSMTMEEHMAAQLYPDWMPACAGAALAGLGLLLALAGLYAFVSFVAARRTHEFGVRMAIGASPRDVVRLVVLGGLGVGVVGGALGLLLALAATRLLRGYLYGVGSDNAIVLAASVASALAVGITASLVPALRASRIDPSRALRWE